MKPDRPRIALEMTPLAWLAEAVALLLLILNLVLPLAYWSSLPERIPTHFGADGQPDGWSGKGFMLVLPAVFVLIYLVLSVLQRFPHAYNYVVKITPENAARQYRLAVGLIRSLKLFIGLMFGYITFQTIQVALDHAEGLGAAFLIVMLLGMFGTIGVYIALSLRSR